MKHIKHKHKLAKKFWLFRYIRIVTAVIIVFFLLASIIKGKYLTTSQAETGGATLTVNPTIVNPQGMVTVSWSNLEASITPTSPATPSPTVTPIIPTTCKNAGESCTSSTFSPYSNCCTGACSTTCQPASPFMTYVIALYKVGDPVYQPIYESYLDCNGTAGVPPINPPSTGSCNVKISTGQLGQYEFRLYPRNTQELVGGLGYPDPIVISSPITVTSQNLTITPSFTPTSVPSSTPTTIPSPTPTATPTVTPSVTPTPTPTPDITPPYLAITYPQNGAVILKKQFKSVKWQTWDNESAVADGMQVLVNNNLRCAWIYTQAGVTNYECLMAPNMKAGKYTIEVRVHDIHNNESRKTVNITLK